VTVSKSNVIEVQMLELNVPGLELYHGKLSFFAVDALRSWMRCHECRAVVGNAMLFGGGFARFQWFRFGMHHRSVAPPNFEFGIKISGIRAF
jgi:hypothetical protein